MLFFLLTLALFQIFLFPGLIFTGRIRTFATIDRWLLAIPVSFLFNYVLIFTLVLVGTYTQTVVLGVFFAEALVLILLYRSQILTFLRKSISRRPFPVLSIKDLNHLVWTRWNLNIWALLVSLLVMNHLNMFSLWWQQFGTTFQDWDGIVSWHHWALSWYRGSFPTGYWTYPQVIPHLQSLIYQMIGTPEVVFASKLIPIFIATLIPIAAIRLATLFSKQIQDEILLAIPIPFYLIPIMVNYFCLFAGGADMAIIYFSILGVYCLALSRKITGPPTSLHYLKVLFLLTAVTATAFVVKQPGVFVAAGFPIAWLLMNPAMPPRQKVKLFIGMGLLTALITLPWYIYVFLHSRNLANDVYLMYDNVIPVSLWERPWRATKMVVEQIGWPLLVFMTIGLSRPRYRFFVFPLLLIYFSWAFYASYDTRNLAVLLPLISFLAAAGFLFCLRQLFHLVQSFWAQAPRAVKSALENIPLLLGNLRPGRFIPSWIRTPLAASIFFIFILLGGFYQLSTLPPDGDSYAWAIEKSNNEQLKMDGAASLNHFLFDYFPKQYGGTGIQIASDYQLMMHLPKLSEFYFDVNYDQGLKYLSRVFVRQTTHFILLSTRVREDVQAFLEAGIKAGKWNLIFEGNNHKLYKIIHPENNCQEYQLLNPEASWGPCI